MTTDFIDEFTGQGGSYLVNKKTGKRTLIERTEELALTPEVMLAQAEPEASIALTPATESDPKE